LPFPFWSRFVVEFFHRRSRRAGPGSGRTEVLIKALLYLLIVYILLVSL